MIEFYISLMLMSGRESHVHSGFFFHCLEERAERELSASVIGWSQSGSFCGFWFLLSFYTGCVHRIIQLQNLQDVNMILKLKKKCVHIHRYLFCIRPPVTDHWNPGFEQISKVCLPFPINITFKQTLLTRTKT